MLFNSPGFILIFLPVAWGLFLLLRPLHRDLAVLVLVVLSVVFYSQTEASWAFILIGSVCANFVFGRLLARRDSRWLLALAVAANLGTLAYFKYADFMIATANDLTGLSISLLGVALPIGISFFTFQQIAYVVDCYRGRTERHGFLDYALFVAFFPQLIAGPIVHHREILPQLRDPAGLRSRWSDIAFGFAFFAVGLFKKVILADGIEIFATPTFDAARDGMVLTFLEAWGGALSYTFQIYFDFSGYSDMAVGLARLFGLRLPMNFNSPYRATSIVDFWRRWHMTLSRFLRDYLYIPLGGRGEGFGEHTAHIMTVMLLGGLWHGAGWTFVAWGGLHGLYIVINHAWRRLTEGSAWASVFSGWWGRITTFVAVVVAWVFFRADTFEAALAMLRGMAGLNGLALDAPFLADLGPLAPVMVWLGVATTAEPLNYFMGAPQLAWLGLMLAICWFLPNIQYVLESWGEPVLASDRVVCAGVGRVRQAVPSLITLAPFAAMFVVAFANVFQPSPFLYFQF